MAVDPRVETLRLLTSIDATLKALLLTMSQARTGATDYTLAVDLDTAHGNPKLRFLPRDWSGSGEFKGLPFSQCPPELLDLVADSLDYFADKQVDEKKKKYDRLDAARARGWAARLRAGYVAPTTPVPQSEGEPTW